MKKHLIGITLIFSLMLSLLGFPFLANLMPSNSIKIHTQNNHSPFFLKNENSEAVLVYFGYVGCVQICTPALEELSRHYQKDVIDKKLNVTVYFVNLNSATPPHQPDIFAKAFHRDFHGIYASDEQIQEMVRIYNINTGEKESAVGHSSYLYLFKKTHKGYMLKNIYQTHPFPFEEVVRDIKKRAL